MCDTPVIGRLLGWWRQQRRPAPEPKPPDDDFPSGVERRDPFVDLMWTENRLGHTERAIAAADEGLRRPDTPEWAREELRAVSYSLKMRMHMRRNIRKEVRGG